MGDHHGLQPADNVAWAGSLFQYRTHISQVLKSNADVDQANVYARAHVYAHLCYGVICDIGVKRDVDTGLRVLDIEKLTQGGETEQYYTYTTSVLRSLLFPRETNLLATDGTCQASQTHFPSSGHTRIQIMSVEVPTRLLEC
jgi:hypothetical protein